MTKRKAAEESGLTAPAVDALYSEYIPKIQSAKYGCEIALLCHTLLYHLIRLVRRAKGIIALSEPIQACCTYIEEHAAEKLTLMSLAKHASYSPDHLSRKFKAEIGESLKDYIIKTKLHRAQLMLTTTKLPVADIAAMLSFCSWSHFTKAFRQTLSQTPADYRAAHNHL